MANEEDTMASARLSNESMVLLDAPAATTTKQGVPKASMEQFIESRIASALQQAAAALASHLDAEAAARAAAAERKAVYLEQELMNVKEQALSMLLNLKHASDSQARDLEKQLSVERKRAEDAEGKVGPLQDLVKRLKSDAKKKAPFTEEQQLEEGVTDSLFLIAGVACDVAEEHGEDIRHQAGGASTSADVKQQDPDEQQQKLQQLRQRQQQEAEDEALARATGAASYSSDESEEEQVEEESSDEEYPKRRQARKRKANRRQAAAAAASVATTSERATRFVKRARSSNKQSSSTSGEHNATTVNAAVLKESSRDSRRLMQGARQLFSLTEQKWR